MKIINHIKAWSTNLPEKMQVLFKVRNNKGVHQYRRTIPFTTSITKISDAIRDMEVDHFLGPNWARDTERKYFKIKIPSSSKSQPSKVSLPWIPLTGYNHDDQIRKAVTLIRKSSQIPF